MPGRTPPSRPSRGCPRTRSTRDSDLTRPPACLTHVMTATARRENTKRAWGAAIVQEIRKSGDLRRTTYTQRLKDLATPAAGDRPETLTTETPTKTRSLVFTVVLLTRAQRHKQPKRPATEGRIITTWPLHSTEVRFSLKRTKN